MRSAGVVVLLTLLAGCSSLNAKTMSYGTMAEARAAGAIDKGWVPAGLPDSVFELRVAYVPVLAPPRLLDVAAARADRARRGAPDRGGRRISRCHGRHDQRLREARG